MKNFLDKDHEKLLETILSNLKDAPTLDEAKEFARRYIKEMKFQKKAAALSRDLEKTTSIAKLYYMMYNTHLSGEGYSVIK